MMRLPTRITTKQIIMMTMVTTVISSLGGGRTGTIIYSASSLSSSASSSSLSYCFTYRLGRSLYVPFTSRCNSLTLPQLRGESFTLPSDVIDALYNVRKVESSGTTIVTTSTIAAAAASVVATGTGKSPKLKLMPPPTAVLPPFTNREQLQELQLLQRAPREPAIDDLYQEINHRFLITPHEEEKEEEEEDANKDAIDSIVIAGEGEPLLRYHDVMELVRKIRTNKVHTTTGNNIPITTSIRLTTNGLFAPAPAPVPDHDHATTTTAPSSPPPPTIPQQLKDCGITHVSVGLMTSDPMQYTKLVCPIVSYVATKTTTEDDSERRKRDNTTTSRRSTSREETKEASCSSHRNKKSAVTTSSSAAAAALEPFDIVCTFIRDAVAVDGLVVETTAVERPDIVDKHKTEVFVAECLGVPTPVRWRPYFP